MTNRSRTEYFVGRRAELATVARVIDDARTGLPSVLLLGGDAGIGKSTLVSVGAERAEVGMYLGRCLPIGGDVIPFAPLADLLRQIRRSSSGGMADSPAFASLADWLTAGPTGSDGASANAGSVLVAVLELIEPSDP